MHKRLENYLNQLQRQLGNLPAEQRDAEIREIRAHLEKLVADYQREGLSEGAALDKAFEQFGSPKTNGRALRQAWNRKTPYFIKVMGMSLRGLIPSFLVIFVLMFTISPSTFSSSFHSETSVLSAINSEHWDEVQGIQQRWRADNLSIQRMNPRNVAAISQAQSEAMDRVNSAMTASANRWQVRIQAFHRQAFLAGMLISLGGFILLTGLTFFVLRVFTSRKFNRMSVS